MAPKTVVYYPDAQGRAPALEFLQNLDRPDQQKAFAYLTYLEEQGEALRRPIAEYAVVLHAFRKKTGPVPANEMRLARTRLADFVQRYERGMLTI